jgi:hypothetical protein
LAKGKYTNGNKGLFINLETDFEMFGARVQVREYVEKEPLSFVMCVQYVGLNFATKFS